MISQSVFAASGSCIKSICPTPLLRQPAGPQLHSQLSSTLADQPQVRHSYPSAPRYCTKLQRRSVQAAAAPASKGFGAVKAPAPSEACPCGSRKRYKECCEVYHAGRAVPATVELALKARFSAYVKDRRQYLVDTTHPEFHTFKWGADVGPGGAPENLKLDVAEACSKFTYSGLKVTSTEPVEALPSGEEQGSISFKYNTIHKTTDRKVFYNVNMNEDRTVDGRPIEKTVRETSQFRRAAGPTKGTPWLFVSSTAREEPDSATAATAAASAAVAPAPAAMPAAAPTAQ